MKTWTRIALSMSLVACGSSTPNGTNVVHDFDAGSAVGKSDKDGGTSDGVDASTFGGMDATVSTAMDAGAGDDAREVSTGDASDVDVVSASNDPDAATVACPPAAGTLTVYIIPPPAPLDWSSPNKLLATALTSSTAGDALVKSGQVALGHEIGHANLQLDCGGQSIPLTGQTGGGSEWQSGADGFGIVFHNFPGELTEMAGVDHDAMVSDVALRQANGLLTRMTFTVNQAMCTRLTAFHDAYVAKQAYVNYSGLDRARRFEGAGCAIFAAGVVDVGGLMRRSLTTPAWSRSVFVGSARFSNFLGLNPYYAFGSNTVAKDANGVSWIWPKGINIPASRFTPCVPESATLDSWNGPEDTSFGIHSLPPELASKVPFSIVDPELMADWAEGVWKQASANGMANALGVTWTAKTVQAVHEINNDASCVMPQTIAFDADNDDLFKDSDAP